MVSTTSEKFVGSTERIVMKKNEKPRSGYTCKFCGKPTDKKDDFCTSDCEIAFLKDKLAKKNGRKDGEPQCFGRVTWNTCVQEFYSTSSFDAKKRTSDLRKLGFVCEATRIRGVPIFSAERKAVINEQMTILTCFNKGKKHDEVAPPPSDWRDGLLERNDGAGFKISEIK